MLLLCRIADENRFERSKQWERARLTPYPSLPSLTPPSSISKSSSSLRPYHAPGLPRSAQRALREHRRPNCYHAGKEDRSGVRVRGLWVRERSTKGESRRGARGRRGRRDESHASWSKMHTPSFVKYLAQKDEVRVKHGREWRRTRSSAPRGTVNRTASWTHAKKIWTGRWALGWEDKGESGYHRLLWERCPSWKGRGCRCDVGCSAQCVRGWCRLR